MAKPIVSSITLPLVLNHVTSGIQNVFPHFRFTSGRTKKPCIGGYLLQRCRFGDRCCHHCSFLGLLGHSKILSYLKSIKIDYEDVFKCTDYHGFVCCEIILRQNSAVFYFMYFFIFKRFKLNLGTMLCIRLLNVLFYHTVYSKQSRRFVLSLI